MQTERSFVSQGRQAYYCAWQINTRKTYMWSFVLLTCFLVISHASKAGIADGVHPKHEIDADACDYFIGEHKWHDECDPINAQRLAARAAAHGGCFPEAINGTGDLIIHQWVTRVDWQDANAVDKITLSLKAFVITQDLRRARLLFWSPLDDIEAIKKANVTIFERLHPHVTLKEFDYEQEIRGTPLLLSRHFSNWTRFSKLANPPTQSDIVRILLLHNYGGLWLDNDAVPLADLRNITIGIGLQFVPQLHDRYNNNHIVFTRRGSSLARRKLEHATLFPIGQVEAWPRFPLSDIEYWVYNDALGDHTRSYQSQIYNLTNADSIREVHDDVEISYPMGWFDPLWTCMSYDVPCGSYFIWHRLPRYISINDGKTSSLLIREIEETFQRGIVLDPQVLGLKICTR